MWAEKWGVLLCPLSVGGAGCPSNTMSPGPRPASVPSGMLIHAPSRLATIDMGRKVGGLLCPLLGRAESLSPSNTMSHGPRPTSVPSGILIHPAVSPQQTWAENWGVCPFWGWGAGSPSNTIWHGPTYLYSIEPFDYNTPTSQTDRQTGQTGQDNGPNR